MTKEEFKCNIMEQVKKVPLSWRKGQAVFNIIDSVYGVAREVQFNRNVDCFYDNEKINEFIDAAYEIYTTKCNSK